MSEWKSLILEAKQMGITKEELMQWFESMKKEISCN